jgi:hypothetical protein
MNIKSLEYRVVAPCVPYLGRTPEGRPKEIAVVSYPFEDKTYSYEEAVDVLRIFTDRWRMGGSRPILEPFMVAQPPELNVRITLLELEQKSDTNAFIAALRAGARPEKAKEKKRGRRKRVRR